MELFHALRTVNDGASTFDTPYLAFHGSGRYLAFAIMNENATAMPSAP